ncbi:hypothetical protein Tco_0104162 [Tanacetum coccineum]
MVPRTILTRSGPISLKTARPVNTVQPRIAVNNAGPMKNIINNAYSTTRRPFNKIIAANNSNFTKKVNTVKGTKVNTARPKAVLSAVKGNKGNIVKASACWVWRPKHKVLDHVSSNNGASMSFKRFDYIDAHGRSKSIMAWETDSILQIMKKLMEDLLPLEVIPKGGKLLGKILKCVVLSPYFKLTDESHVLLKVPRKDNMYSVGLKNVVPYEDTLPIAKHSEISPDAGFKPSREEEKMDTEDLRNESEASGKDSKVLSTEEPREDQRVNQELDASINNTNNINNASNGNGTNNVNDVSSTVNAAGIEVNAVNPKTSIELPNDPNMPELEDIVYSDDD